MSEGSSSDIGGSSRRWEPGQGGSSMSRTHSSSRHDQTHSHIYSREHDRAPHGNGYGHGHGSPVRESPAPPHLRHTPEIAPSRHYAFPSPSRTGSVQGPTDPSQPHLPSPTTRPQRISISSTRSRRASPLLHEIQPPNRRLSSHQMLLLTPFGAVLPAGALPSTSTPAAQPGSSGMAKGGSSMGRRSSPRSPTSMIPSSSSMGRDRSSASPQPPSPVRTSAAAANSMSRQFTRRHHSLANPLVGPSPLASAPMTTIQSVSDHDSSSSGPGSAAQSREPSHDEDERDMLPSLIGGFPGAVPMTRSSSLPVMTLRELQALKEKDGALGIARGGGWAWVSHREEEEDAMEVEYEEHTPASTARASLSTASSSTTPPAVRSLFPFTTFNDPFAPSPAAAAGASSSGMQRDGSMAVSGQYNPTATVPGYQYSPTHNDSRRMSDATAFASSALDGAFTRRPSAPSPSVPQDQSQGVSPLNARAPLGISPRDSRGETMTLGRAAGRGSINSVSSVSPQRPKITRYKSLPGRQEGLGLDIVFRKGSGSSSVIAPDRRESEGGPSSSNQAGSRRRSTRGRVSGSWAAVDIIDSLAATEIGSTASHSPISSGRTSIHTAPSVSISAPRPTQSHSISPTTAAPVHAPPPHITQMPEGLLMVENITTRAHLAEFGTLPREGKGKGRARWDSVDSAFQAPKAGGASGVATGYVAQLAQSGWNATFPRRGSLAVLSRTALGPWAAPGGATIAGLGLGDKDRVVVGGLEGATTGKHWSERRGSWAEGWGQV